jgi:predicted metal-dependent phosphoesterase TrpH
MSEAMALYEKYECRHEAITFPSVSEACAAVRAAGGKPVLAHPGKSIDTANLEAFVATLVMLVKKGVAGIECYYPAHSPEITDACLRVAAGWGC